MQQQKVTCWNCGATSTDAEWCDTCGADLSARASSVNWLDAGDAFAFELEGKERYARVTEIVESYTTRRVLHARLCPAGQEETWFDPWELAGEERPDDAPARSGRGYDETWRVITLDETADEDNLQPTVTAAEVSDLLHVPFSEVKRGNGRVVEIFEQAPGAPLREYLESLGRLLSLEEAAGVSLLLMDAVERVHQAALYHFQICPWTIRIAHVLDLDGDGEPDVGSSEPLRLSFEGIRGFYDAKAEVESHPVITGFSPPEFFGRSNGVMDQRVDVFGIGMLFYYLLAGCRPPTGSLTRHVPHLPVRAFRFEFPPGLQSFIDGCCAFDPEDRYPTVGTARTALLEALDVAHRRSLDLPPDRREGEDHSVSLYCAVDRHIGIGKGRRYPVNQDAVFLGHDPSRAMCLVAVADGVSTATYGSGDVASKLLVEAAARHWERRHLFASEEYEHQDDKPTSPGVSVSQLQEEHELSRDESADTLDPPDPEDETSGGPPAEIGDIAEGGDIQGRVALASSRASGPTGAASPFLKVLGRVLNDGNRAITEYINDHFSPFKGPVHEVMGTTGVLGFFYGDKAYFASLGDSRIYLVRHGHMELLTKDHNLATLHMLEGFPADEALSIPHGKALARCLGTFQVKDGRLGAVPPEPDYLAFRVLPGDILLLTTDGLIDFAGPTELAAERAIQHVLETEEIPSLACLRLMLLANEGGGEDNIGLAVIRVTRHHDTLDRLLITQAFPPVNLGSTY